MSFERRRGGAKRFWASLLAHAAGFGVLLGPSLAQVQPVSPHVFQTGFDGQRLQESTPAPIAQRPAPTPQPTPAPAPHPTPPVPEPPQAFPAPPAEQPWPPFMPQKYVFPAQLPTPPGPAFNIPGPPGSDPLTNCPFCEDDPREDAPTIDDIQREHESQRPVERES